MLSQAHRLNKQRDFDNIWQRGGIAQDGYLVVKFLPNQLKNSRFAIVVSAKAAPRAVDRNRVRRQMAEVVRLNLKQIKSGLDVVLVVRARLVGATYEQIKGVLIGLLKKKGLYV